jgi:uncharacterized membrane protein YhfC
MTEFDQIVIGKASVPSLILTILFMTAIPVVGFLFWRRKNRERTHLGYCIAGAIGFIVSARVLELGVHYFCILAENPVSRFINGNTVAYVVYGCSMAGIFEECGRYVILKYILKKNRTWENAVLYGIGHGGIEILTAVLPLIVTYLVIAVLFSAGNTEQALRTLQITEETAAAALPTVQTVAAFDYAAMALNVLERLLAMIVHIGFSVLVFYGIQNDRKGCLPLAILLHMLVDTFAGLYQRGVLPLWSVEVWGAVWTAVIAWIAIRLCRKMNEQAIGSAWEQA